MSTKLTRTTMLVAALGLATSAFAGNDLYQTRTGATNWAATSSWEVFVGGTWKNDTQIEGFTVPNAGDTVTIKHDLSVGANAGCAALTIDANKTLSLGAFTLAVTGNSTFSGTLSIAANGIFDLQGAVAYVPSGGQVTIAAGGGGTPGIFQTSGAAPGVVVVGTMTINGQCQLSSSSGTPYLHLQTSRTMPAAGGQIMGIASASAQPEIRLDSGVTMTNAGTLEGYLVIKGSSSGVGTFANNSTVTANAAAELKIDSSLSSISDNGSAVWAANNASSSAVLRINEPAASLAGQFQLNTGAGRLAFGATVGNTSAPPWLVNAGTVIVDFGCTFHYGTVTGTCGSKPSSNGSLTAGTYNYCLP